jgi:hypothetical protein
MRYLHLRSLCIVSVKTCTFPPFHNHYTYSIVAVSLPPLNLFVYVFYFLKQFLLFTALKNKLKCKARYLGPSIDIIYNRSYMSSLLMFN